MNPLEPAGIICISDIWTDDCTCLLKHAVNAGVSLGVFFFVFFVAVGKGSVRTLSSRSSRKDDLSLPIRAFLSNKETERTSFQ